MIEHQTRLPATTALFIVAPLAMVLVIAVIGPLFVFASSGVIPQSSGGAYTYFSTVLEHLFFATIAALFYLLTHWPFIPLLHRARGWQFARQALVLVAMTSFGAVLSVLVFAGLNSRLSYSDIRYDAQLGAAVSAIFTLAVLGAARWYDARSGMTS